MKTDRNAPIGVFDSGVGGLTVAREIMRNLPMAIQQVRWHLIPLKKKSISRSSVW